MTETVIDIEGREKVDVGRLASLGLVNSKEAWGATTPEQQARQLYEQLQMVDVTPVIHTLQEEEGMSEHEARDIVPALWQWLSVVPTLEADKVYVMLKTRVDQAFHATVLNTAFYRGICEGYLGQFIDHTPMDPITREQLGDGAWHAVERLEAVYGDNLHPALKEWRPLLESGDFVVSCGICPDDAPGSDTVVGHLQNGVRIVH